MTDHFARLHAWYLWHSARWRDDEEGQATTEYALMLLAAALVALMVDDRMDDQPAAERVRPFEPGPR